MNSRRANDVLTQTKAALRDLERILDLLPDALARDTERMSSDGLRSSVAAGGSRQRSYGDPTGSRALIDNPRDLVQCKVAKMARNLLAVAAGVERALAMAQEVSAVPIVDEPELPLCVACGKVALPRPRRGMCLRCYDRQRRAPLRHGVDLGE